MAHRGIILLPMLVAAVLGSGSKMEHAKDRAGIAAEEERSQSWADWALTKAYQLGHLINLLHALRENLTLFFTKF